MCPEGQRYSAILDRCIPDGAAVQTATDNSPAVGQSKPAWWTGDNIAGWGKGLGAIIAAVSGNQTSPEVVNNYEVVEDEGKSSVLPWVLGGVALFGLGLILLLRKK